MASTHLVACPGCARHVRVRELACPFCQTALSEALRATPAPRRVAVRLTRMAMYAVGGSALAVAAACSSEPVTTSPDGGVVPAGVEFPPGDVVGGACTGDVYVDAIKGTGYLICDGSSGWVYDSLLPSGSGGPYYGDDGDAADDADDDAADDASDDARADASDDAATDASDEAGEDASDDAAGDDADSGSDAGG